METAQPHSISPQKILPSEHRIDESKICDNARQVVNQLLQAGYEAFLVGGCVRDLLLGVTPKDFDVATNAHPEQICELFGNSRLIGRRFQIVHVYFNREYIEVSTFRALVNANTTKSVNGRIVRDNTFGNIEEDAMRRDFTINAMYFDLENATVLDFCNGLQDIKNKCLRIIGQVDTRYREDPVRMLRALRFRAKLNFNIETTTADAITSLGYLLKDVPPARLFDEVIKLFHSGHAVKCFHELNYYHLFEKLFPLTHRTIKEDDVFKQFVYAALENTDSRIKDGKSVNPAFIFAVFLWKPYLRLLDKYTQQGIPFSDAAWEAGRNIVLQQSSITSITKRFSITICEIWKLQNRFLRKQGRRTFQFMQHQRFRAAYDFMCLRVEAGELDESECQWWTTIQTVSANEQRNMINKRNKQQHSGKRNKSK